MTWRHSSGLYDQDTFYKAFIKDLSAAKHRVIIESPFISNKRIKELVVVLERLSRRGVHLFVNTKPIDEHDELMGVMAARGITQLQNIDVTVLLTFGHHRKLAVIDDSILWEGSLNILSQNDSCEIMRRIESSQVVNDTIKFLRLDRYYRVK